MIRALGIRKISIWLAICMVINMALPFVSFTYVYADDEMGFSEVVVESVEDYYYESAGMRKGMKVKLSWSLKTDLQPSEIVLNESNFENYYVLYNVSSAYSGGRFENSESAELRYSINSIEGTVSNNRVSVTVEGLPINVGDKNNATGHIYIMFDASAISLGVMPNDTNYYDYIKDVELITDSYALKADDLEENTIAKDNGLLVQFDNKDLGRDDELFSGDIICEDKGVYFYTGKKVEPSVIVYDGNVKLKKNYDYKVSYFNNKKLFFDGELTKKYGGGWCASVLPDKSVKNPYVLIEGINAYKGTKVVKFFNIVPAQFGVNYGIRANATMKSNRLVKKNKEIRPKVVVSIQKWDAKKELYNNTSVLKEGKDYTITYRKAGTTEDLKAIPAGAVGDYIAIVSSIPAIDNESKTAKVETASSMESRIDAYYNKIEGTEGLKYPKYYRNIVSFTINDKSKDLTKAKLSLDEGIKTVSYDVISVDRPDVNLKAWQLPSDKVKVELEKTTLDPSLYEIYVGDNYRGSGEKRALMVVPTKEGMAAGYYGTFSNLLQQSYVLLWSDLTITGIDINKTSVTMWYLGEEYKLNENATPIKYVYDRYNPHSVKSFATEINIEYDGNYLRTNANNTSTDPNDAIISVKEGSSGLLGKTVFLVKGIGKFSGEREIAIEVVTPDGNPLKVNDIFYAYDDSSEILDDDHAFTDGVLNLKTKKYYNSKLDINNIDFSIRSTINRNFSNNEFRELKKDKDYKLNTTIEGDKPYGKAKTMVTFLGDYAGMEDAVINYEILPAADENLFDININNINLKGEATAEALTKKFKVKITENSTKKKLKAKKDYMLEGITLSSNGIYYAHIVGAKDSGYEGLSIYRSIRYNNNLNPKFFKAMLVPVNIGCKGDLSYLEDGRFLKQQSVEGIGEYGEGKDFYFKPVMVDKDGNPDAEYYGSAGNKKVYLVATDETKKCSGSCIVTIKVMPKETGVKDVKDGGYNYVLSLLK